MRKILEDMTLEELWRLFPIVLTPHNPDWQEWAREEIIALSELLEDYSPIINHIGSTAIPGIHHHSGKAYNRHSGRNRLRCRLAAYPGNDGRGRIHLHVCFRHPHEFQ